MKKTYTIAEIEAAINYWQSKAPSDGVTLGPEVRSLSDCYGSMIYQQAREVEARLLNEKQVAALSLAIN